MKALPILAATAIMVSVAAIPARAQSDDYQAGYEAGYSGNEPIGKMPDATSGASHSK